MRAVVCRAYGSPDVMEMREVAAPSPKDGDLLIKIHAATVTAGDCELRRFKMQHWIWLPARLILGVFKLRQPILGQEFAGEVIETGKDVTRVSVGDRIFGSTGMGFGAYADYLCRPESAVLGVVPPDMAYETAATLPVGGINALHFLRKADLQPGQHVLFNGSGGSIGTYGIQIAKHYGLEVTAVDSTEKHAMLRGIGADHVIDYRTGSFTANTATYDAVIDIVGLAPFAKTLKALKPGGRFVLGNPRTRQVVRGILTNWRGRYRVLAALAGETLEDYATLKDLIRDGAVTPVIDRRYPLEEVPDAHRYVEAGLKQGNVIITVAPAS